MTYMVGGFRSGVPEHAGWNSHIPEPDWEDEGEEESAAEETAETAVCRAEFYGKGADDD